MIMMAGYNEIAKTEIIPTWYKAERYEYCEDMGYLIVALFASDRLRETSSLQKSRLPSLVDRHFKCKMQNSLKLK